MVTLNILFATEIMSPDLFKIFVIRNVGQWYLSPTDVSNMVTRRKSEFASYFNDTNIIHMLSICTKDGREYLKGSDLLSVFVVTK